MTRLDAEAELARYRAAARMMRGVHRLMTANLPPAQAMKSMLQLLGQSLHADRAYTFTVSADRTHSSCTYEWTSRPEYNLLPQLQNVDQRGLKGWLDRFKKSSTIAIEDVENPPDDLRQPAAKFARDLIKSIYVFGFYDEGRLVGYLGVDFVEVQKSLDRFDLEVLQQVAATLNLFLLRHSALEVWKRVAETMPASFFIKDADNGLRYCYANPRYLKFYGSDVLGKNDQEIFGAEFGSNFQEEDRRCLETGEPFLSNGLQNDYSRTLRGYFSTIKFPVRTQLGQRLVAGIITDITAEHNLRLQAQELLAQAKAAEQAKGLFLASMSHEIRTPLNVILGLVEELRHNDVSPENRRDYLAAAASAGETLLALVNDVLDVSKIEAGQMRLAPAPTDMAALFADCATTFGETCRQRSLAFTCAFAPGAPRLLVDATRIKQILFNLIGNAVKFTAEGSVTVEGAFAAADAAEGTLTLRVRDTGIGISPEDQKHVFGLYEQASALMGTGLASKGSGLGLSLCKRLAQCMGGDIVVASELGKGSTFTVTLPHVRVAPVADAVDAPSAPKEGPLSVNGRVLVVDDVPMNVKVLKLMLDRLGVACVTAGSGAAALDVLAQGDVAYVLTDMWMPEMDGAELARRIRANPEWKDVTVAALTADVEAARTFDVSRFDAVLAKPVTPAKLRSFLDFTPEANERTTR